MALGSSSPRELPEAREVVRELAAQPLPVLLLVLVEASSTQGLRPVLTVVDAGRGRSSALVLLAAQRSGERGESKERPSSSRDGSAAAGLTNGMLEATT